MENIIRAWDRSGLTVPSKYYVEYNGIIYLTITDHGSVFYFMAENGSVYSAVRHKCRINGKSYKIDELDALQIVSCPRDVYDDTKRFVYDSIIPLIFGDRKE